MTTGPPSFGFRGPYYWHRWPSCCSLGSQVLVAGTDNWLSTAAYPKRQLRGAQILNFEGRIFGHGGPSRVVPGDAYLFLWAPTRDLGAQSYVREAKSLATGPKRSTLGPPSVGVGDPQLVLGALRADLFSQRPQDVTAEPFECWFLGLPLHFGPNHRLGASIGTLGLTFGALRDAIR